MFCNHLHEDDWSFCQDPPTKCQLRFSHSIMNGVNRLIAEDVRLEWSEMNIAEDLKKRMISYTGEEVSKPEMLTIRQVLPGLPPEEHGGGVPVTSWLNGRSLWYLENPPECIVPDTGQPLPKLQAKVHVAKEEALPLARELVRRRICRWTEEDDVLRYRGEMVLNGAFGVQKSAFLDTNEPVLRFIMNLIPSNSVHKTISGRVSKLPSICSWTNIFVDQGELVSVCQSDMAAAFYLFALPPSWSRQLCFNLSFPGSELGFEDERKSKRFYLSCGVLPMGWSSAVGIMQFIAEEVLMQKGFPSQSQLRSGAPLPPWMVEATKKGEREDQFWWHVYLDNYASGERVMVDEMPIAGRWQASVEEWWEDAGIVCSRHKSVVNETKATELGAFISGRHRWIGASPERILKLAKTTLWLLSKEVVPRKLLQVVMGRWIFILQFRRPSMAHFQKVWETISSDTPYKTMDLAKQELATALWGLCLCHTFLGAEAEDGITCSDASTTGGAIAFAETLSEHGHSFMRAQEEETRGIPVPVVVISLFNGIGGAYRCYDLAGVCIRGGLAVDIHGPACRVMSRRWPGIEQWSDIRELSIDHIEEVLTKCEPFDEIHIWGGFPCVDLSRVRHGRKNLAGPKSSLLHEGWRICREVRGRYHDKQVHHVLENVSSMDISARDEISGIVGGVPFKLDPRAQVPMSRPRFCWTDVIFEEVEGVKLQPKDGYVEINVEGTWPAPEDWLDSNSFQNDEAAIYPTFMKSIPRAQPPPAPAGVHRCDQSTLERWESDSFRFPPYQYKEGYLIWDDNLESFRLLSPKEREKLMGFGPSHTVEGVVSCCGRWFEDSMQSYWALSLSCTWVTLTPWTTRQMRRPDTSTLREQRRARRGTLCLEDRGIAPSTRIRYFTAVRKVLPLLEKHSKDEDEVLSLWIEEAYLEGEAITQISDTLTGELLSLYPFQVLLGRENAIIQLGATKSGLRRNQDENVIIEHPATLLLLDTWLAIRKSDSTLYAPLFCGGSPYFRENFKRLLGYFNLSGTFRPYSLRRGGATHDFRGHGQMERTLIRGRWASNVAARQYIQEGLSVLATLRISDQQARLLQQYASTF
eukprot:Skav210145  [mRNA]  locus=scaffold268:110196:114229:+ [translate_table: standard]